MIFWRKVVIFHTKYPKNVHVTLIISTIELHRHLGVTFSTDAKWNAHIENIVSSVSKHINIIPEADPGFQVRGAQLKKLRRVD
jgi:hypothetical protein